MNSQSSLEQFDYLFILSLGVCGSSAEQLCCVNDQGSLAVYNIDHAKTGKSWSCDTKETLTGLATLDHHLLLCSGEADVKMWDTRQQAAPVMVLRDTSDRAAASYSCVAVSGAGLVVAGTHQLRDESYLLFWDTRQGGQLQGGYWDSHCDDITSASFQADTATLATGCTDGLVNILDLTQQDEDEALVTSLNTQDSVARVTWYQDSRENHTLTL